MWAAGAVGPASARLSQFLTAPRSGWVWQSLAMASAPQQGLPAWQERAQQAGPARAPNLQAQEPEEPVWAQQSPEPRPVALAMARLLRNRPAPVSEPGTMRLTSEESAESADYEILSFLFPYVFGG